MTDEQRTADGLCHAHEIKEVPRYGIPGTIWDKKNCPYCEITRLRDLLRRSVEFVQHVYQEQGPVMAEELLADIDREMGKKQS